MKITEVGKYRVDEQIGSGTFGKVYKGRDKVTGEVVALKVINHRGKNKKQFESLRQEVQILKKLNHPNIVMLKDHVEADSFMILIMEYAPKDLAAIIQKTAKLREEEVRRISSEILSALVYLNENRIVHRDLKPQNILLNEAGSIKICDFGFARKMSTATVCLHSMKGTPLYIAPEIIEAKPYGPKIDVWSLGVIMYELSVGSTPFLAENFQKLAEKILRDRVLFPNFLTMELRELLDGMLQKNPNNRYDYPDIQKHVFFNPPPPAVVPLPVQIKPVIEVKQRQNRIQDVKYVEVKPIAEVRIIQVKPVEVKHVQAKVEVAPPEPVEVKVAAPIKPVITASIKPVEPIKIVEEQTVNKPVPIPPATLSPRVVVDSYDMLFSVMLKSYEVSKSLAVDKELTIEQLKEHEKQLKAGNGRPLKTDLLFFHQVAALFNRGLNEETDQPTELMLLACRVMILLINKVKLEQTQQENDITRKRDLFVVIAKLIGVVEDEECLMQLFTLCLYLLKINFSPVLKEMDMDVSLDIIESSERVLKRQELSVPLLTLLCKTIGTLAVQASLTVRNAIELYKMVDQSKLMSAIASKYRPDKELSTIFECLEKFVHGSKLESYNAEIGEIIGALSADVAKGLLKTVETLPQVTDIYSKIELEYFFRVVYAAVKASAEFAKTLFSCGWSKGLQDSHRLYSTAILLYAVRNHGLLLKEEVQTLTEGNFSSKDPLPVLQNALAYWSLYQHPQQRSLPKFQAAVHRVGQMLMVEDQRLQENIKELEGWPVGHSEYSSRDILLETAEGLLQLEPSLLTTIRQSEIIFHVVRSSKITLKPRSLLSYLVILDKDAHSFEMDQKTFTLLQTILPLILAEDSVGRIRDSPQHISSQIFIISFALICRLINKDEAALDDLFQRLLAENVHRVIFTDSLLNETTLTMTLKVVMRIIKKCDSKVLDFITVQALPKIKGYFDTRNSELLVRLLQIASVVARAKPDYYPKLQQLELSSKLCRYLTDPDVNTRIKALNLIGNMAKHNSYFLEEFKKFGVPAAIVGTLSSAGGNQESLAFQVIFAFGNICFLGQQYIWVNSRPQEVVAPLIPYLYEALFVTAEAFLCNALGTLTHLVRHGGQHIKPMLQYKLLPKVVQIVQESKSPVVQNRGLSFLEKLLDHQEVLSLYPSANIKVSLSRAKPLNPENKERLERTIVKLGAH